MSLPAVESGRISEERLDESVRRILTLKEKADLSLRASTPADTLLDRLSRLWN